jgi:hypothetical protein
LFDFLLDGVLFFEPGFIKHGWLNPYCSVRSQQNWAKRPLTLFVVGRLSLLVQV